MTDSLVELDSLEILVIVDNEVDPISTYSVPGLETVGNIVDHVRPLVDAARGNAKLELRMDGLCCGAHGLSLMITAVKDGKRRTMLFDTAPEGHIWELNAMRLKADIASIEWIQLSHWHCDHSGGMIRAVNMISEAKRSAACSTGVADKVIVDLHPDRPTYRGLMARTVPISMEANPSFDDIEMAGAEVVKNDQPHVIMDGSFLVSGEIPRVTPYEVGIPNGLRLNEATNTWNADELIPDERLLMCKIKDKGLVVFSGCSHAGIVNATRHALELAGPRVPLYAVVGGYHLVGQNEALVERTVHDLATLDPKVLIPGHCTGWRAKFEVERVLPGRLAPSTVGTKFAM